MLKSKVLEILSSFTKEEIKEFRIFLESRFFNKNKQVVIIYNELLKFHPSFDHENLTKENLHKIFFAGDKFKEWKIRNLLAELSKLTDEFLIITSMNKRPSIKNILLNYEFLERELSKHFDINYKAASNDHEKNKLKDSNFYYDRYIMDFQNMMNNRRTSKEFYNVDKDVKNNEKLLEDFYILELAKLFQPAMATHLSIITAGDFKYFDYLYNYLRENKENLNPSAMLYYKFFTLCKKFDYESYIDLKKAILANDELFSVPERNNFYILLHNFLLNGINTHHLDYWAEYGEVVEIMVEKKIGVTIHGKVNPLLFRNAVKIFVRNNNLDKAGAFIEKYYMDISEEFRLPNYYYAMALVMFHKKEFERSLETASKVKYGDFQMKFLVYSLILRNYYELGYIENCYVQLDAAHQGIIKDKVASKSNITNYINFINYFRKILDARSKGNYAELDIVKRDLEAEVMVAAKDWLLEKTAELTGKGSF